MEHVQINTATLATINVKRLFTFIKVDISYINIKMLDSINVRLGMSGYVRLAARKKLQCNILYGPLALSYQHSQLWLIFIDYNFTHLLTVTQSYCIVTSGFGVKWEHKQKMLQCTGVHGLDCPTADDEHFYQVLSN